MTLNGIKTLAVILTLATASLPYQAIASNSNIATVINQEQEEKVTGTVVHVDEESISCYMGSPAGMSALSDFKYEILRVATSKGDTLNFVVPQSTEYKVGDKFNENVTFSNAGSVDVGSLIKEYSRFSGAIQPTYIKARGIINRK